MTELTTKKMVEVGLQPEDYTPSVSITLPEKMPLSALLEKVAARAVEMEKQLALIADKSEAMEAIVEGIVDKAMETVTDEVNYYTDQEVGDAKESMNDRVDEAVGEQMETKFLEWLDSKNFKIVMET